MGWVVDLNCYIFHAQDEVDALRQQLVEVEAGERFILQGGDCAERFQDCNAERLQNKLAIILQMSLVLVWGARIPLVRIGRIAGQCVAPAPCCKRWCE